MSQLAGADTSAEQGRVPLTCNGTPLFIVSRNHGEKKAQ